MPVTKTLDIETTLPECQATAPRVQPGAPVLALVGGADPQDPITNLSDLKQHFPDSRIVIFPHVGHSFGIGGCVDQIMADLVDRGTTRA